MDVTNLTALEEVLLALKDVANEERVVREQLDGFLAQREQIEARLELVELLPTKLRPVCKETRELWAVVSNTCILAEKVSSKVRVLDRIKENIDLTIKKVVDIIDVKNCMEGVQRAMREEDFERAAAHIQRYLNIDESVLEGSARQMLKEAERQLKELVKNRLEAALKADNQNDILRFCKLYTPLGMHEEGLLRYSHYLRRVVSNESAEVIKKLTKARSRGYRDLKEDEMITCVDAITLLFESIAGIIEDQTETVEKHFSTPTMSGGAAMVTVLKNLQAQCDIHATKIIDYFLEDFKIAELLRATTAKPVAGIAPLDPREITDVLDHIALLSQRCELFDRFIRRKAWQCLEGASTGTAASASSSPHGSVNTAAAAASPNHHGDGLMHVSELNRRLQELMNSYIALEQFYLVESVNKAVRMHTNTKPTASAGNTQPAAIYAADFDGAASLVIESTPSEATTGDVDITLPMVDLVFFILQKTIQRALMTANADTVCAVVNLVNNTLGDVREVLLAVLRDYSQGRGGPTGDGRIDHLVVINSLEAAAENIIKLKVECEAECRRVFGLATASDSGQSGQAVSTAPTVPGAERVRIKLDSCLEGLSEQSKQFKQCLQVHLEQSVENIVVPRLRPLLELFAAATYEMSEYDYSDYAASNPLLPKLLAGFESILRPFRKWLSPTNHDALVQILSTKLAVRLEKLLLNKKFNQYGSFAVERDIRGIVGYFASLTMRTVRLEFARLTQMIEFLNMQSVEEAQEYWGGGNASNNTMTWRLTPSEVRRVLSRRVDFRSEDIAAVKFEVKS